MYIIGVAAGREGYLTFGFSTGINLVGGGSGGGGGGADDRLT